MNPYRFLSKFLKGVTVAVPLLLYGGGLTSFWVPCSLAGGNADKAVDNFAQTEIFQELKAEDEAALDAMKKDLDIAQEKQEKGEISLRTYLDMKYDYDQKLENVNSREYIVSAMEKYDRNSYDDYKNADEAWTVCAILGAMYTTGGCACTIAFAANVVKDFWFDIDYMYDGMAEAYDEKKNAGKKEVKENYKETKELGE